MFDGITLKIGTENYIVPPLNFKGLRKAKPLLDKLPTQLEGNSQMSDEQMDAMLDFILLALSRNYPDMTKDQLEDILDMANIQDVMAAITGQSGLIKKNQIATA